VNTATPWGWVPTFNVFVTTGCQHLLGIFVQPSLDDHRVSCQRAQGRWDGAKCIFVRFVFDFDRDKKHDHDHDRDRDKDRDCDRRDDHDRRDRDHCDRDRDHDRDDCDRGGNDFARDRGGRDCDRDHDNGHGNDNNNGPRPCEGNMVMIDGRCRPRT
jgi:hypothetical protein